MVLPGKPLSPQIPQPHMEWQKDNYLQEKEVLLSEREKQ